MSDEHIEADLIAYLDDELDAAARARVEAHLARCERCTRALTHLRAERRDLRQTFDAAISPVRLPYEADRRIRERLRAELERPRSLWSWLFAQRGAAFQAVMALLLIFFSIRTTQTLSLPPAAPQETLVLGQNQLAPGRSAALRVLVRTADAALPLAGAEVVVSLRTAPDVIRQVYRGATDADGAAEVTFTVPEDLPSSADLVVETRSPAGEAQIVQPIRIQRAYKMYLGSDKPAYQPGQTLHLRALVLDAADFTPAEGEKAIFAVHDPAGREIFKQAATLSEFGIAALDVPLPAGTPHGAYTLRATLGDTTAERAVTVDAYELPAFQLELTTDRSYYTPGMRVSGVVTAAYFFGQPVAAARVQLQADTAPDAADPRVALAGQTDADGRFEFAFDAPANLHTATLHLQAAVTDNANQQVGRRTTVPVAAEPIRIQAAPESGILKPGVENIIYVMTSTPDGAPVSTDLTISFSGDEEQRQIATDAYGLATFRLTPPGDAAAQTLEIAARDATGAAGHATLSLAAEQTRAALLLRTERAAYEVGETLRLEALTSRPDGAQIYLDVIQGGQMIAALSAPATHSRAAFALDLDAALVGALNLRAYALLPDGEVISDARLVAVDAPQQLNVDITADQAQYRPGETARVAVQSSRLDATGAAQPAPSALGLAVVDASVFALETLPPSFARTYLLLEKAMIEPREKVAALDLPALLEGRGLAEQRAAQDVAAQAAWAGAASVSFPLRASAIVAPPETAAARRRALANHLAMILSILPLIASAIVARELTQARLLGQSLRACGWKLLILAAIGPFVGALGVIAALVPPLGMAALVGALALTTAIWGWLWITGWRRGEADLQLMSGVLGAYIILSGLLLRVATEIGPAAAWIVALVAAFLWLLASLLLWSQGLILRGRRARGWLVAALTLLLMIAIVTATAAPAFDSPLSRRWGNPRLYAGPLAWMTGCGAPAPETAPPEETEGEIGEAEEPRTEEEAVEPAPQPTATAPTLPAAPYPLRHIFPETLYWMPEAITDDAGRYAFDLPLADTLTSWRVTALASTRDGVIGAGEYDLVVYQEFFIDVTAPTEIAVGEVATATVTVYNYLPEAQTVELTPVAAEWYALREAPPTLTLAPGEVR
ncbi:MAG: MG2 domain-containing protein, partial [Anaerolineales bacterium]